MNLEKRMETFPVKTSSHDELIDITSEIKSIIKKSGIQQGVCCVYTPHTTAAITINENADPDVQSDLIRGLKHFKLEESVKISVDYKVAELQESYLEYIVERDNYNWK